MKPSWWLHMIFIVAPLIITFVCIIPAYIGIYVAVYVIYSVDPAQAGTVAELKYHIGDIWRIYLKLIEHWQESDHLDFQHFTLPLFGLPTLGIAIAATASYKWKRFIRRTFFEKKYYD